MKKLSIIIPYHNEDESRIEQMFLGIDNQAVSDWNEIEIIVSNDHIEPKDMSDFFYKFQNISSIIRYLHCPIHFGPGPNRQYATENALGKYIMYLDSDDKLLSPTMILEALSAIESNYDVYECPIVVEIPDENGTIKLSKGNANRRTLVGKLFKLDFLKENDIRFSDDIYEYEDTFFDLLVRSCRQTVGTYADTPFYLYKFNENSVSRIVNPTNEYIQKNRRNWFLVSIRGMEWLQSHHKIVGNKAIEFYLNYVIDRYSKMEMHSSMVTKETLEHQVGYMVKRVDPTLKLILSQDVPAIGKESFHSWIKRISMSTVPNKIEKKYNFTAPKLRAYVMD